MPVIVSTTAQLVAAISAAAKLPASALAGYVIALAPGNYDGLQLNNQTPAAEVVITSQDPARLAVIGPHVGISQSANLTFRRLEFTKVGSADPYYAWRISGARNLTFDHDVMHGDPTKPLPQGGGFYVLDSANIAWTTNRFTFDAVINANRNTNLTISGNDFGFWSKGAIELGAVGGLTIVGNTIHDSFSSPGTHPDGLQIYTAGQPTPSHDVVVTDNVMFRGGGNAFQGIFIQDEGTASPYTNVTVARNAVIGCMWDCIRVWNATGAVKITDNIAWSSRGPDSESTPKGATSQVITAFSAGLQVKLARGATLVILRNAAQAWTLLQPGQTGSGWTPSVPGNVTLGQIR